MGEHAERGKGKVTTEGLFLSPLSLLGQQTRNLNHYLILISTFAEQARS